jgi:thiazole synthase
LGIDGHNAGVVQSDGFGIRPLAIPNSEFTIAPTAEPSGRPVSAQALTIPNSQFPITEMHSDPLIIAGRTFRSRLVVGTGKYPSHAVMADAHRASGADMVTVAVRRVNLSDRSKESLLDFIDTSQIFILPNTAGCYTAEEAIRTARLGREVGLSNWVKLEVIGDEQTLFPDNIGLLEATRVLVQEGFVVLPYTNDDPVICRKLEEAGAAAVMPLGAPIGSGLGIQNPNNIRIIKAQARVPVIVDAGVGTPSDAAIAMELGADGVLMNTAIALAQDPVAMAAAMKLAVEAGRIAFLAGRIPRRESATPSSPGHGLIGTK